MIIHGNFIKRFNDTIHYCRNETFSDYLLHYQNIILSNSYIITTDVSYCISNLGNNILFKLIIFTLVVVFEEKNLLLRTTFLFILS